MSKDPKTLNENSMVQAAVEKMENLKITSLFIVNPTNPKKPVGLIRMHDLLDAKVI